VNKKQNKNNEHSKSHNGESHQMPIYKAPIDNIKFILHDVLKADQLSNLPGFEDFSLDLADQIIEEGAKICEDILFPLNWTGDQEGCMYKDNQVTTPKGFIEAYKTFAEGGWCGLSSDPEYGGMGMPMLLNTVMQEIICASNMSFGMYPGLSQGCYEALYAFGSETQKSLYLPKLTEGTWSGTMNLTEPHCGTDLGLIRTKAENYNTADESYEISGQKIFISAGEHDLTENIVHLVLARLPDAPKGVKGISLFVVPKFLPDEQGEVGTRNTVYCSSIEHKMGINANATCVMQYEKATGWLVGEPHKGLKAMFTMMNAARLGVAMQGLGIGEVAYQNAVEYAKERTQMRALDGVKCPDKEADPIIVHPDVRRMLLIGKAFTEGARALSYWCAMMQDISHKHTDQKERQAADDLVSLLTPILKSYQTDMGSLIAALCVQTHGGMGYIGETGVEQYMRDAKIAEIYEGTNGIQALDLVGRKMGQSYGRLLKRFFHPVQNYIESHQSNADMQEFIFPLAKSFAKLQISTATLAEKSIKNPLEAGAGATDYLNQFALVAMAYMWALMSQSALEKIAIGEGDQKFYQEKLKTARFFMARMLPEADAKFKMVLAGANPLMEMDADQF